jgi:hypothetical protein
MAAYSLLPLVILLRLILFYVLVRKYLKTRDSGFIWFGVSVLAWPIISGLLNHGERSLIQEMAEPETNGYLLHWVAQLHLTIKDLNVFVGTLQQSITVSLLLMAALHFYGKRKDSNTETTAA